MLNIFPIIAQADVALPSTGTVITALTLLAGGIGAVYSWFRAELKDCQKDRKELFARIEQLHDQLMELSTRMCNVERKQ